MPEEIEEWLDDVISCEVQVANTVQQEERCLVSKVVMGSKDTDEIPDIPTQQSMLLKFVQLQEIHTLEELRPPNNLSQKQ